MNRVILHVDMDAFFASVEILDNPSLRGKPVIVGGMGERGVVSTCSYEARKFGVHSAMPVFIASKKCPHGIFVPVRMYRYKEISSRIFDIFRQFTDVIEPLSIDEAFLDLTDTIYSDGIKTAMLIKQRVLKEIGLTLSVGVSYNKFLAKLASDWNKPNGIKVITEDMLPDMLFPLSINKIFGLGKKSVQRLNNIGIYTVKDLYDMPRELFSEYFGKSGEDIYNRIRGIDNRLVTVERERKSVGKERTLKVNTMDKEELLSHLKDFSRSVSSILIDKNVKGKTITLKFKTASFINHTRSRTLLRYIDKWEDIYKEAVEMLSEIEFTEEVRLIGLSVSSFMDDKTQQISFRI